MRQVFRQSCPRDVDRYLRGPHHMVANNVGEDTSDFLRATASRLLCPMCAGGFPNGRQVPGDFMWMGMAMRATLSTSPLAMLAAKGTGSASAAAPPVELPASRLNRLCALRWHIAAAPLPDYGRSKGAGLWN